MTYSAKKDALFRVEPYLTTLADATENVTWHTSDPVKLAYAIRQGCNIAANNPETFPKYKDLQARFKFKVLPGKVIASLKVPTATLDTTPSVSAFIKTVDRLEVPDTISAMQIVGACISNRQYEELFFPDADLDDANLKAIYRWTSNASYNLIRADNGLIVTKRDVGEAAWKP